MLPGPRDAGRDEHRARRAGARAREPRPRRRPRSRARVEEVALALGIDHLLDRSTAELSGGELQRVALGAALARGPRLVLLDEPTSQLDPVAGDELIWQLRRLNQEWDTAVLLVEHRLERCLAAADRVIALDGGRVVCDGDPRGFLAGPPRRRPRCRRPARACSRWPGLRAAAGRASSRRAPRCAPHGLLPRRDRATPTRAAERPTPPRAAADPGSRARRQRPRARR